MVFTLACVMEGSGVSVTLDSQTDANSDAMYYPRVDVTGGVNADVDRKIVNGHLVLTVASGGDSKSGGAIVFVEH